MTNFDRSQTAMSAICSVSPLDYNPHRLTKDRMQRMQLTNESHVLCKIQFPWAHPCCFENEEPFSTCWYLKAIHLKSLLSMYEMECHRFTCKTSFLLMERRTERTTARFLDTQENPSHGQMRMINKSNLVAEPWKNFHNGYSVTTVAFVLLATKLEWPR